MKKVLVTGGAGYLGSTMVPLLLAKGYTVTVLDNLMYQQNSLLECCYHPRFQMVRGDARDTALVKRLLRDQDIILPLACYTGAPLCKKDPTGAKSTNLDAIRLILKLRSRQQRIIYPTTNSGYGVGQPGIACDENSPLRPISLYGRLKVDAEKCVLDAGGSITYRLATVFGVSPRMRLDLLVNDFTYRAVYDRFIILFEADFIRNYVHVRDVARVFLHGLDNFSKMQGRAYNVGLSSANLSKRQLCERIRRHVPEFHCMVSEIGKDPDQRNYIVSNERLEKTGFRARYTLDHGIRELVKGYQIIKRTQYANV